MDTFKCCGGIGCTDLEDFLKTEALDVQDQQIATTVIAYCDDCIVGYITYGVTSIIHEYEDAAMVGIHSHRAHNIPALKIYQLAIAEGCDGRKIGTALVGTAFGAAKQLREIVPLPQIIVKAYEDAVEFYERFGFELASDTAQIWAKPFKLMFAGFETDE